MPLFQWLKGSERLESLWGLQKCCSGCQQPKAGVYQLQQLFHPARNQASARRVGELRFITPVGSVEIHLQSLSPDEGFHKAFMGYLFQARAWLVGLE